MSLFLQGTAVVISYLDVRYVKIVYAFSFVGRVALNVVEA